MKIKTRHTSWLRFVNSVISQKAQQVTATVLQSKLTIHQHCHVNAWQSSDSWSTDTKETKTLRKHWLLLHSMSGTFSKTQKMSTRHTCRFQFDELILIGNGWKFKSDMISAFSVHTRCVGTLIVCDMGSDGVTVCLLMRWDGVTVYFLMRTSQSLTIVWSC